MENTSDSIYPMRKIASIRSDFPSKFGIPRQSGLVEGLKSIIVFEKEYRQPEALRGLSGFSHIWLLWYFSEALRKKGEKNWSPTVRPPRLGGNSRMGVFATRSPFRPNPIGLSCVRLEGILQLSEEGTALCVSGADLMDGTPILDIKPYLPYTDCRPEALSGFAEPVQSYRLHVDFPEKWLKRVSPEKQKPLCEILAQDPRPSYQRDETRIYGFVFSGWEIRFIVRGDILSVVQCDPCCKQESRNTIAEKSTLL